MKQNFWPAPIFWPWILRIVSFVALLGLAADELVALLHAMDVLDLRPGGQRLERLVRVLVADGGDDGLDLAVDGARLVAELRHFGDDFLDLFKREVGLQNNNHGQGKIRFMGSVNV